MAFLDPTAFSGAILDAFDNLKTEQAAIVASVNKVQPLRRASMWLTIAATVFVISYYAWDIFGQFK